MIDAFGAALMGIGAGAGFLFLRDATSKRKGLRPGRTWALSLGLAPLFGLLAGNIWMIEKRLLSGTGAAALFFSTPGKIASLTVNSLVLVGALYLASRLASRRSGGQEPPRPEGS